MHRESNLSKVTQVVRGSVRSQIQLFLFQNAYVYSYPLHYIPIECPDLTNRFPTDEHSLLSSLHCLLLFSLLGGITVAIWLFSHLEFVLMDCVG